MWKGKLVTFGCCQSKGYNSLFSILQGQQISLSGESAIRTISMVLDDGTFYHRENVVDALIVYNNQKCAKELLEKRCPDHWKVEVFRCVKAMVMEKETEQAGKFSGYKLGVPMIVLRINNNGDEMIVRQNKNP